MYKRYLCISPIPTSFYATVALQCEKMLGWGFVHILTFTFISWVIIIKSIVSQVIFSTQTMCVSATYFIFINW